MSHSFPPPPIEPIDRLNIYNGLAINAERWKSAHHYHQQRQQYHYQSINQPGVVRGLGVCPIEAPHQSTEKDQDGRWIQVQPGVAIDLIGNPIVIPHTFNYHINTDVTVDEPITIYLVVTYRDPDEFSQQHSSETIQETFRLVETKESPTALEVELCRILLRNVESKLSVSNDVFFPGYDQLDLRYRLQAQIRPNALVKLAQISTNDPDSNRGFFHLSYLLQAFDGMYPKLQAHEEVGQVSLTDGIEALKTFDLLYLTGKQTLTLSNRELNAINEYLTSGGVILIDAPEDGEALIQSSHELARQLNISLQPLTQTRNHPIRTRPFLFSALPVFQKKSIQLLAGGGLLLSIGDLARFWGLDDKVHMPRYSIRTGHEFGINIVHYAWQRRQLTQLQKGDPKST